MKKTWVIPDIHGYSNTLKALIEEQIKPTRNDILYFLGDYIDRGPDTKGVIDYIMYLQKDEYTVKLLKGNHEDYLLRVYDNEKIPQKVMGITVKDRLKSEWYKYGGKKTLLSFQARDVKEIPENYIQWLRGLKPYFKLDKYVLVHAGLNFEIDDPFKDLHGMMWLKEFKVIPEKINGRKVIHGHVPVSIDFIDMVINSSTFGFIDLDNGVYMPEKEGFGNLLALELSSMQLVVQHNVG